MIAIGADHGGFELKEHIKKHLDELGLEYKDYGTYSEESVDYPDCAKPVCEAVMDRTADKGILICGTGIGISIAANKVKGVRCALCADTFSAKMTRLHNNANVLALGGGIVGVNLGLEIVSTFLNTPFSEEGKHIRRIDKIGEIERKYMK